MLKHLSARHKMIIGAVVLVVLVLAVLGNSLYSLAHNKSETYRLRARAARLDKEYEELFVRLEKLREQDPALMEHIARTQYHMTKKGETEFRFTGYDKH